MRRKTLDDRLNEGGLVFWIVAVIGAVGFYGLIWLMLAVGTMAGF